MLLPWYIYIYKHTNTYIFAHTHTHPHTHLLFDDFRQPFLVGSFSIFVCFFLLLLQFCDLALFFCYLSAWFHWISLNFTRLLVFLLPIFSRFRNIHIAATSTFPLPPIFISFHFIFSLRFQVYVIYRAWKYVLQIIIITIIRRKISNIFSRNMFVCVKNFTNHRRQYFVGISSYNWTAERKQWNAIGKCFA